MIGQILSLIGTYLIVLCLAILAHEAGHIIYLERLGYKVSPRFKRQGFGFEFTIDDHDLEKLSPRQFYFLNFYGVVLGALPIIAATYLMYNPAILILLGSYAVGCLWDFRNMIEYLRGKKDEKL